MSRANSPRIRIICCRDGSKTRLQGIYIKSWNLSHAFKIHSISFLPKWIKNRKIGSCTGACTHTHIDSFMVPNVPSTSLSPVVAQIPILSKLGLVKLFNLKLHLPSGSGPEETTFLKPWNSIPTSSIAWFTRSTILEIGVELPGWDNPSSQKSVGQSQRASAELPIQIIWQQNGIAPWLNGEGHLLNDVCSKRTRKKVMRKKERVKNKRSKTNLDWYFWLSLLFLPKSRACLVSNSQIQKNHVQKTNHLA